MPKPRSRPSRTARFMRTGVSSTIPKRPEPSVSSTGSEVFPHIAISKSWIAAAPFMATAVNPPSSTRERSGRCTPVLITCPPSIAMTGRSCFFASAQAAIRARREEPVRRSGRKRSKDPWGAKGSGAGANCSTRTLVGRSATGMVRTSDRSISSRGLNAFPRMRASSRSSSRKSIRSEPCS